MRMEKISFNLENKIIEEVKLIRYRYNSRVDIKLESLKIFFRNEKFMKIRVNLRIYFYCVFFECIC